MALQQIKPSERRYEKIRLGCTCVNSMAAVVTAVAALLGKL